MPTLLCRALEKNEQTIEPAVRKMLVRPQRAARNLWLELGLEKPDALFAAVMSMVQLPPVSPEERARCEYLLAIPEFFSFLTQPEAFSRPTLVHICRALLDAKLAGSLFSEEEPESARILHVLGVLDEISPGGRLTFILTRLLRECTPAVAAKAALLLARRVYNPTWVERCLSLEDARLRANVIESLWGMEKPQARAWLSAALEDPDNRVAGNALYGLHVLKDARVFQRLQIMLAHPQAAFRATAAWVMGRTGERRYIEMLRRALDDGEAAVRDAARRALANYPAEEAPCPPAESAGGGPARAAQPQSKPAGEALAPSAPALKEQPSGGQVPPLQ
jgi:hypothetical protein